MLNKPLFIKSFEAIEKEFKKEDAFNNALDEYNDDVYHCFLPARKLLEKAFVPFIIYALDLDPNNSLDEELVLWFLFDCDRGHDTQLAHISIQVTGEDGKKEEKEFQVVTPGAFYDFVKIMLEEREKDARNNKNKKDNSKNSVKDNVNKKDNINNE